MIFPIIHEDDTTINVMFISVIEIFFCSFFPIFVNVLKTQFLVLFEADI